MKNNPRVTKAPPPIVPTRGHSTPQPKSVPTIAPPGETLLAPAQFDRWKTFDVWTVLEAAHLLCGLEPPSDQDRWDPNGASPERLMYRRVKDAVSIKKINTLAKLGAIRTHRVAPHEVISWALSKDIEVPAQLSKLAPEATPPKATNVRAENNLYRIIGALVEVLSSSQSAPNSKPAFDSEAALIRHLEGKYKGIQGLSKRNLEKAFPIAKDKLNEP